MEEEIEALSPQEEEEWLTLPKPDFQSTHAKGYLNNSDLFFMMRVYYGKGKMQTL